MVLSLIIAYSPNSSKLSVNSGKLRHSSRLDVQLNPSLYKYKENSKKFHQSWNCGNIRISSSLSVSNTSNDRKISFPTQHLYKYICILSIQYYIQGKFWNISEYTVVLTFTRKHKTKKKMSSNLYKDHHHLSFPFFFLSRKRISKYKNNTTCCTCSREQLACIQFFLAFNHVWY